MNKFIKLHNTGDNSVIIVRIDKITMFDSTTDANGKCLSEIYVDDDSISSFSVNENPDKIYEMLVGTKMFIRLHNVTDNSVVCIKQDKLVMFDTSEDEYSNRLVSEIYVDSDDIDTFKVNETPDKIYNMIAS